MAMLRYGNASVVKPFIGMEEWLGKTSHKDPGRVKVARTVVSKYDPSEWLLTHVSIMASVDTELADKNDPKSNYLIKPEYSQFVNNNGDAWERELLRGCYKTFLGADNFLEHLQIKDLSKGKVIDVAIREVVIGKDSEGKDLTTLYVDILIATNRKHKELIDQIESGEYNATSMGCLIQFSQCSCCGNVAKDETEACMHVKYYKGNTFYDDKGVKRKIAELCGHKDDPSSVKFIDASWVKQPAFTGAVLRNIVKPEEEAPPQGKMLEQIEKALLAPSYEKEEHHYLRAASDKTVDAKYLSKTKNKLSRLAATAEEIYKKEGREGLAGYLDKNLKDILAQDPEDKEDPVEDTGFPSAPETTDTPDSPDTGMGDTGDTGETPEAPKPDVSATPVEEIKDEIKKTILERAKQELLNEQQEVKDRPLKVETYQNDSLVRSFTEFSKKVAGDKVLSRNKKLLEGVKHLAGMKKWVDLKKLGYSREDVLGILHLYDLHENKGPLSRGSVEALSRVRLGSVSESGWKDFFVGYMVEKGGRVDAGEYKKVAKWARILQNF